MALRIETVTVDAAEPRALALFWAKALQVDDPHADGDDWVVTAGPTTLLFLVDDNPKTVKNRLHLDLRPDDQQQEVDRLLALGATFADIGQGEQTWVVLADPEGNEFCILRNRSAA
jgi:hypothetical protein